MFAKLRLTFLCSTVAVILAALLAWPTFSGPAISRIWGGFNDFGLHNGSFIVTSPSPGNFKVDALGQDIFFAGLNTAGRIASFKFSIDTTQTPDLLVDDVKLVTFRGDRIFGKALGTVSPPDLNGVRNFVGTITFFGGTGNFRNAKGSGEVIGSVNTQTKNADGTSNGSLFFTGLIRTS